MTPRYFCNLSLPWGLSWSRCSQRQSTTAAARAEATVRAEHTHTAVRWAVAGVREGSQPSVRVRAAVRASRQPATVDLVVGKEGTAQAEVEKGSSSHRTLRNAVVDAAAWRARSAGVHRHIRRRSGLCDCAAQRGRCFRYHHGRGAAQVQEASARVSQLSCVCVPLPLLLAGAAATLRQVRM